MKSICCNAKINTQSEYLICTNCLSLTHPKRNVFTYIIGSLVFLLALFVSTNINSNIHSINTEVLSKDINPLDTTEFCTFFRDNGGVLFNIAYAQCKIESSNFTSCIYKENKNLFGIRTSTSKLVQGKNRGHCTYNSYKDCILDYIRIQNKYLKNIDGKYAESPEYIKSLKNVK